MSETRRRIDWEEVRARLRAAEAATGQHRADVQAVYRRRALELAARRGQAGADPRALPVLAFTLGPERYGLALAELRGVLPLARWTPVPGAPPPLLGVINHRGRICSVLDLARLLGLSARPAGEEGMGRGGVPAYVLLLRREGREVGLRVDAVEAIRRVAPAACTGPGEGAGPAGPYLSALTPDRLCLLSADALRAHPVFTEGPHP